MAAGGGLGLATRDGGIPGFTMTGCIGGAGVSARRVGAGGAEAARAAAGGATGAGAAPAGAGGAAGGGGRRGRAGLVTAGFTGTALDAASADVPDSASFLVPRPVAASAGRVATPAAMLADEAGALAPTGTGRAPVSGGKAALTSFGDGAAASLPDAPSEGASASVGRRWGRRRRGGGALSASGGSAILASTPLFRHIKEIPDLGAILPSA